MLSAQYCSNCGLPLNAAGAAPAGAAPVTQSYSEKFPGTAFGAPAPAAAPVKKEGANPIVVLAVIAVIGIVIYLGYTRTLPNTAPRVGPAANLPPAGTIWFGSSFDSSTFEIRGQTSTATVGQTFAMVGHLTREVSFDQLNIRISLDGTTYANQQAQVAGSGTGDVFGFTYLPPIAGSYRFDLTDIGGSVLASGTIVVR